MAKKLSDIARQIESREGDFAEYLNSHLSNEVNNFLQELSERTNAYLFSGLIRNYFLNVQQIRDLDIVIKSEDRLGDLIKKHKHRRNSFGGYKLIVDDLDIDLWNIESTWAFTSYQKTLSYELDKYIPYTAFFNFSSVLYSLNEKKFIYTKHFLSFLRDKEIDVVFEPNANYQLCLVNSFYYSDRYHLKVSEKLREIIKRIYLREDSDYSKVQEKHFGKILYDNSEIERRISALSI